MQPKQVFITSLKIFPLVLLSAYLYYLYPSRFLKTLGFGIGFGLFTVLFTVFLILKKQIPRILFVIPYIALGLLLISHLSYIEFFKLKYQVVNVVGFASFLIKYMLLIYFVLGFVSILVIFPLKKGITSLNKRCLREQKIYLLVFRYCFYSKFKYTKVLQINIF